MHPGPRGIFSITFDWFQTVKLNVQIQQGILRRSRLCQIGGPQPAANIQRSPSNRKHTRHGLSRRHKHCSDVQRHWLSFHGNLTTCFSLLTPHASHSLDKWSPFRADDAKTNIHGNGHGSRCRHGNDGIGAQTAAFLRPARGSAPPAHVHAMADQSPRPSRRRVP